jgi:hypothetical protein
LNLNENTEYSLKRRTFGTGLSGYALGWFRLHNGEKALVYLTRRWDIVYLPSLDGYSFLISVEEPEEFIATLQEYDSNKGSK